MRLAVGGVMFLAGAGCLALTPMVDPWPWIVVGWTLLLTGIGVMTPVLVDWVDRDDPQPLPTRPCPMCESEDLALDDDGVALCFECRCSFEMVR